MQHFHLKTRMLNLPPAMTITLSFVFVITTGAILLCLPISSKAGTFTPFIDALFTAATSTCVTGLVVYDTFTHWSAFGQVVILLLIQIGGIGLVTFAIFFSLLLRRKMRLKSLVLAQESINNYDLPDTLKLVKTVIAVTFTLETLGSLILMTRFIPKFGADGIFTSIFMAVSAFCNAGIDLLGREGAFASLTHYNNDPVVLITIMTLIIIGGLGFVVWMDLSLRQRGHKMLLHTKIVLIVTAIMIFGGAFAFLLSELNNPATIANLPWGQRVLASFFQSITPRTAGFNSVDINALHGMSKILIIVLMFIGAAPGSTAGGIKVTTFSVAIMTVISVIRGRDDTIILKHKISKSIVYKSITIIAVSMLVVILSSSVIWFTEPDIALKSGLNTILEAVSAFGTVGLSSGLTPFLHGASKIALILTMFFGRIGPITLSIALAINHANRKEAAVIPEGRIIVG